MKVLLLFALSLVLSRSGFAQMDTTRAETAGIEFKVISCLGDKSAKTVAVQMAVTNKNSFDAEKVSISRLAFVDDKGGKYFPLGKETAVLFPDQTPQYVSVIKAGATMNTVTISISNVSPGVDAFKQISLYMKQIKVNENVERIVTIDSVPIRWHR